MSEMKRAFESICDSYELEIRMLDEAIQRVRELHKPVAGIGVTECAVCIDDRMHWTESVEYPCPTIKALDGEQC
jgi:hypothetical protein